MSHGKSVDLMDNPGFDGYHSVLCYLFDAPEPLTTTQLAQAANVDYQFAYNACSWWFRRNCCERIKRGYSVYWWAAE